jgi:hexosaminidase
MCWLWAQTPVDGVKRVVLTAERIPWRDGDEAKNAVVHPKASAAGEFEIHADSCTGPLMARLPLEGAKQGKGQVRLDGKVVMPAGTGVRDLCVITTGDPRDGQWALAHMVFSK